MKLILLFKTIILTAILVGTIVKSLVMSKLGKAKVFIQVNRHAEINGEGFNNKKLTLPKLSSVNY